MKKVMIIYLFFTAILYGQGSIPMNKESFTGALEFLPNGKIADGYYKARSPFQKADPTIDPENWYVEGNQKMRGMIGDAVLFFQWWTKASMPTERYKFEWKSSGYFEVEYINDKGEFKNSQISRNQLEKYPNLLQRFDNIKPLDITFEFTFHAGNRPDKEYYAFRNKYNLNQDLGSLGYAVNYTRKLNGFYILYKPSGKSDDWVNPGVVLGGWDNFLIIPDDLKDKKSRLIELFKMGRSIEFSSFKISSIKWRLSDFVYIAKKFEDYESGKDKPTAFDEVANGEKENKAGDGFWDETDLIVTDTEIFYENGKYGLKTKKGRIIISPKFNSLMFGHNEKGLDKFLIGTIGNDVYLLTKNGNEIKRKTYENNPSINPDLTVNYNRGQTKNDDYRYYVSYWESESIIPGKEDKNKLFSINYDGNFLIVASSEKDERTPSEKKRDKDLSEQNKKNAKDKLRSEFKAKGYSEK